MTGSLSLSVRNPSSAISGPKFLSQLHFHWLSTQLSTEQSLKFMLELHRTVTLTDDSYHIKYCLLQFVILSMHTCNWVAAQLHCKLQES